MEQFLHDELEYVVVETFDHARAGITLLRDEVGLACEIISIDGVDLRDFDFVDVGAMVTPPGVIPLVIKSLIFR